METTNPSESARLRSTPLLSSRIGAYVALVRLPNCIMIGLGVVVGETIALAGLPPLREAALGFLTAFLLLAGSMVLNDIQDVEIDRVNSPHRPLPMGRVTTADAYVLSIVLSGLAVFSSILLGWVPFLITLLALVLMVFYDTRGKKTGLLGNGIVSFNVALPFFFGGLVVEHIRPLLFMFFLLAFLATMAREVAKGIPDAAGDRLQGIKTVAVRWGSKPAAQLSAGLFGTGVILSFLAPVVDNNVSWFYYPGVVIADLGFLYSSYRLVRDQAPDTVRKVKTQVLLWMLLGLVGFLMGAGSLI